MLRRTSRRHSAMVLSSEAVMISFFPSAQEPYKLFVLDASRATHGGDAGLSRGGGAAALKVHIAYSKLCACMLLGKQYTLDKACVLWSQASGTARKLLQTEAAHRHRPSRGPP